MRTPLLSIFAVVFMLRTQAQPDFEKIYLGGISYKFNLLELNSRNIFTGMGGAALLDSDGNIMHASYYPVGLFLAMQSVRYVSDNEYYFVTGYHDGECSSNSGTTALIHPAIGKMDSLGDVLALSYYALNAESCWNLAADLEITADKSIITWGRDQTFFAMKVDSTLQHVWSKTIGHAGGFRFIKELPGGDLLAGFDMDTAGASVARLDADGNFLWCKSYMRPAGKIHDAVIESDDSFIITGYTESVHPKLFMLKLDGAGDVQWCKGYDSAPDGWYAQQWSRIEKTSDGDYAVLATLGQSAFPYFYRPFLMRTDENGDTLWTRSVGDEDYVYYTRDLLVSSDGGFLFSGGVWGDLPENNTGLPYIFKADSQGHFSCSEQARPVQVLDLFPTDSSFTLTSIDGATMIPSFVNDTVFNSIAVYNACDIITGVAPDVWRPKSLRVRPNPSAGRFTVQFADPLLAESYYSVYDAMGRLLYQRPLSQGQEAEEVDLSRYGQGTYLIKFTDRTGVCYERVVVSP